MGGIGTVIATTMLQNAQAKKQEWSSCMMDMQQSKRSFQQSMINKSSEGRRSRRNINITKNEEVFKDSMDQTKKSQQNIGSSAGA
ncbi:hypothetical protein FJU08_15290 [Martelella alba]|uniref:Uncharacterized protein n=1 Tax=Martelella alba TaxID=2590451 RepID=A0A506U4D2_9HYPH|nr:hypothetical protein [Martelella alba]TPW29212.1 hypothetical protein FJU08_15290 [Martelella alba]